MSIQSNQVECNHTAVGMIVERNGSYLLFRRVKPPWGIAPSAGHVDELPYIGHPDEISIFEMAAMRELNEEVGLEALSLELLFSSVISVFPCRRIGGDWHQWRVYRAIISPDAQPQGKVDEAQDLRWYCPEELTELAERTNSYLGGEIEESDWQAQPGIEPVWLWFFTRLGVV